MSEVKKCPKCGGEMVEGELWGSIAMIRIVEKETIWGRGAKVRPLYCSECGYVELYREMKEKKE